MLMRMDKKTMYIFIAAGAGGAVVIISIVVLCCYCCKRRSRRKKSIQKENLVLQSQPSNKGFEKDIMNTYQSHTQNSSASTHENKGFVKSPKSTAFKNTGYVANQYGDLGKIAASPFVGSQNKRLYSIASSVSNSSLTNDLTPVMNKERISRVMKELSSSVSMESAKSADSRKDSGYKDVKCFYPSVKQSSTTTKQVSFLKISPYETCELNFVKPKERSHSSADTREPDGYLSDVELQRFASTGHPLRSNPSEFKRYTNLSRQDAMDHYEKPQHSTEIDRISEDDNEYTDITVYENKQMMDIKEGCTSIETNPNTNDDDKYREAYQYAPKKHSPSHYEVPMEDVNVTATSHADYSNINVKQEKVYTNFDYEVPCINPTQTDSEDVYVEFMSE